MALYCARSDVYATGLPPEAFARPPRAVEGVTPSTGTFALRSHGLAANAPISLAVMSIATLGAAAAAPPAGSSASVPYYALPVSSDLFQIATAPNGSPLTFSDAGSGIFGIVVDHGVYLDAAIARASDVIDQYARAHTAPIQASILTLVCAFLAARIYVATHRALIPEQKAGEEEAPSWVRSLIDKLFAVWLNEAPILGAVDATPAIAEAGGKIVPLRCGDFDLQRPGGGWGGDIA